MKTIFTVILVMFSSLSFAESSDTKDPLNLVGDRCAPGEVIFYGQNEKHAKEVLVCQLGTNVFYSFGKIGKEPEMVIKSDSTEVKSIVEDTQSSSSEDLFFKNGDIVYQVGAHTDLMTNYTSNALVVTKFGKGQLAEIMLDETTVVNGIRSNFIK